MIYLTQPWVPLTLAYSLVMIVALLAIQFMSHVRFQGNSGELMMVILMSTGILLLIWIPFPWGVKIFPTIVLAFVGARLTRANERTGYLMGQMWCSLILYFISISGILFN